MENSPDGKCFIRDFLFYLLTNKDNSVFPNNPAEKKLFENPSVKIINKHVWSFKYF